MKALLFVWISLVCMVMLAAVGCTTQKKCNRMFPPQIMVVDSTVYRDSLINFKDFVTFAADSAEGKMVINHIDTVMTAEIKSKSGNVTGTVIFNKGNLAVKCKMDSLQGVIDSLLHIPVKERYVTKTKVVEKPVDVYHVPKWCWWLILVCVGLLAWIFRKPLLALFA